MKAFLITITILPFFLFSQTDQKILFNSYNSPITENNITSIATDNNGLNWIGTLEGLMCFNGDRWFTLNTQNSKLPSDKVLCVETVADIKYIGTTEG